MLIHSCVPETLLLSTVIPIRKYPILDISLSSNYRAILFSSVTVMSKVYDKNKIQKQIGQLSTSNLQFGYKMECSTVV